MSSVSESQISVKRRELLATMGLSAVAGCGGSRSVSSPAGPQEIESEDRTANQADCIDRTDYNQLQDRYDDLRNEYSDLRDEYNDLRSRVRTAKFPPYIVTDRRSVSVTYETLDGDFDGWRWDSSTLSAQFTAGNIVREMSYSQLEYLGWSEFGFEGRSKYTQLGDFGLFYQLNPFVIPSNFTPLSEEIYDRHQTNLRRIEAAWNFTTQLNNYVSEIEETPRFPLETLLLGGGDCEDSAILLGSILYSMPVDFGVTFWYIDANNPTDPQDINHVILSAETAEGPVLIETTGGRMSPYTEVGGFSVPIEPGKVFEQ